MFCVCHLHFFSFTYYFVHVLFHSRTILCTCYFIHVLFRACFISFACYFVHVIFHSCTISCTYYFVHVLFRARDISFTFYFMHVLHLLQRVHFDYRVNARHLNARLEQVLDVLKLQKLFGTSSMNVGYKRFWNGKTQRFILCIKMSNFIYVLCDKQGTSSSTETTFLSTAFLISQILWHYC